MAVTWTISTLERNTEDGVVVAHWQASDVDGDHTGSSYGTCGFTLTQMLMATQPTQT